VILSQTLRIGFSFGLHSLNRFGILNHCLNLFRCLEVERNGQFLPIFLIDGSGYFGNDVLPCTGPEVPQIMREYHHNPFEEIHL
jgi:hypothetical protein